ncbi:MAG: ABC transporter ATP-binding protein, partial [bacterium]
FVRGTINVIIGRNGAGKTTLLRAIAGLTGQGEVLLEGRPIRSYAHQERARHLSFLPQLVRVPDLSVRTLVAHGRFSRLGFSKKLSEEDEHQIDHALRLTGMRDYASRMLGSLSGGELKKAYCAMMIAQDADYLLLDEPTAYLDITASLNLMALFQELRNQGKCIILTCHDLPQAFSYADRILLLDDHQLIADESPQTLSGKPELIAQGVGVILKEIEDPHAYYRYILVDKIEDWRE